MSQQIEKKAFRVSEAVYAYGLGRTKIYELFKDGALRPVKIGGITLIPRDQLDALLAPAPDARSAAISKNSSQALNNPFNAGVG